MSGRRNETAPALPAGCMHPGGALAPLAAGLALAINGAMAAPLPPPYVAEQAKALLQQGTLAQRPAAARPLAYASGHVLVQLSPGADRDAVMAAARRQGLEQRGRVYGTDWYTLLLPPGAELRASARVAASLPGVRRAMPDPIIQMLDDTLPPRDPMYALPNPGCNPEQEACVDQWGLFQVGAMEAWQVQTGAADVVIAIIDSGLDLDHDDIYANVWTNAGEVPDNGLDDDGNGLVDDVHGMDFSGANIGGPGDTEASLDGNPDIPEGGAWYYDSSNWLLEMSFAGDAAVGDGDDNDFDGYPDLAVFHGTAVAGIAAAMANNPVPDSASDYEGMVGACWHCRIMPLRITHAEGNAYLSDAASAFNYAALMGADVINASWGYSVAEFSPDSPEVALLSEVIGNAIDHGAVVVAAAGNAGTPGVYYPAADPRVIAVGASGQTDARSDFSSYGLAGEIPGNGLDDDGNGWTDDVIDVVAPGEGIWTSWVLAAYDSYVYTWLFGLPEAEWPPGADTYGASDGTSFAAPLVAGYVGLLRSQCPGLSAGQVRSIIQQNALDIGLAGYDAETGYGRLQMRVPQICPGGTEPALPPPGTANSEPVAVITGATEVVDSGKPGQELVSLSGAGSYDPDAGDAIMGYGWSWSGTASGSASGPELAVVLATGSYTLTLRVADGAGAIGESSVVVDVKGKGGSSTGGGTADSSAGNEKGARKCSDGIDNDGDGAIDAADLGCA